MAARSDQARVPTPRTRLLIVTPAPAGSRKGNRITAERWARMLRAAGYLVQVAEEFHGQPADILIALHARKSARSIARFHDERPRAPVLVVLTGTDLYHDLKTSAVARRSLDLGTRLILLQPEGKQALAAKWRHKARVIRQSAAPSTLNRQPRTDCWEVCVVGHLRPVKDPFRAALAARHLPPSSKIHIVHIGAALTPAMRRRAEAEMARNHRYTWLGERSHAQTLRRLAQCRMLVLSSRLEGGANVLSEAIVTGIPILASRIPGSVGLLGKDYPGFFQTGNNRALARLLHRAETDAAFLERLTEQVVQLRSALTPESELAEWREVFSELETR